MNIKKERNILPSISIFFSLIAVIIAGFSAYISYNQYLVSQKSLENQKKDKEFQLKKTIYDKKYAGYLDITSHFEIIIALLEDDKKGYCCNSLGILQKNNQGDLIKYGSGYSTDRFVDIRNKDNYEYLMAKKERINSLINETFLSIKTHNQNSIWSEYIKNNLESVSKLIKEICPKEFAITYEKERNLKYYEVLVDVNCKSIRWKKSGRSGFYVNEGGLEVRNLNISREEDVKNSVKDELDKCSLYYIMQYFDDRFVDKHYLMVGVLKCVIKEMSEEIDSEKREIIKNDI